MKKKSHRLRKSGASATDEACRSCVRKEEYSTIRGVLVVVAETGERPPTMPAALP